MTRNTRSDASSKRRGGIKNWIGAFILLGVIVAAGGVVAWKLTRLAPEITDPNVLVNLSTMVGKEAPWFTLTDSEGQSFSVRTGNGKKYVLVFHMGSI